MSKKILLSLLCVSALKLLAVYNGANSLDEKPLNADELKAGFETPPNSAKPLTWWHWINGSVSKDGIEKDFKSFKESGIGGVQLLNANMYVPPAHLRFHSEDWFDYVNYAIQKADEYGLEFAIMNSDGWANSGGPWVSPEKSMKMLVWSELDIEGGKNFEGLIPKPKEIHEDYYEDLAVFLLPQENSDTLKPTITCKKTDKKSSLELSIIFEFQESVSRRLLTISKFSDTLAMQGKIYASQDGKSFEELGNFEFKGRSRSKFTDIAFNRKTAKYFKLEAKILSADAKLDFEKYFSLSDKNRLSLHQSKALKNGINFASPDTSVEASNAGAIDPKQCIDISKNLSKDGKLTCKIPQGKWTVLRMGYTSTGAKNHPAQPEGHGLEIDKFEKEFVRYHIEKSLGRTFKESKKYLGKAFNGILLDSWEVGFQGWTQKFPEYFLNSRAYDMRPFLPVLTGRVIESAQVSNAFLCDYRKTANELCSQNYFGEIKKIANENNMVLYAETYVGYIFNELEAAGNVDVNMSEFWLTKNLHGHSQLKKMSSPAHITGRRVMGAESFTARDDSARWTAHPMTLKPFGDMAFARGLNRFVFHTSAHQPNDLMPGFSLGRYGTHFGRANVWWKDSKAWLSYVAKSQYLLQRGRPYADILYLISGDNELFSSANSNTVNIRGYDYELCIPSFLGDAKAIDGKIKFESGMEFSLLITQDVWSASLKDLQKIKSFKDAGVPILGSAPTSPDNLQDTSKNFEAWQKLAQEIWKDSKNNYTSGDIEKALLSKGKKKDFLFETLNNGKFVQHKKNLNFIHRKNGDMDIYFVANAFYETENAKGIMRFNVADKTPEIWDAQSGSINPPPSYFVQDGYTCIPVDFAPFESTFVIFRNKAEAFKITSIKDSSGENVHLSPNSVYRKDDDLISFMPNLSASINGKECKISSATPQTIAFKPKVWNVSFSTPFNENFSKDFTELKSFSDCEEKEIKYFSGTAKYSTTLEITADLKDSNKSIALDLGEVANIARLAINGKEVGICWTYPFRFDITKFVNVGKNLLEISVTNTWVNRMIADENLPQDTKYDMKGNMFNIGRLSEFPSWYGNAELTAKRERKTWAIWKCYDGKETPIKAGLLGPVTICVGEIYRLN